jgi:glyoxylase-like metal-dependent hydrolase (beta-lactamase superfamily II)
MRWDIQVFELPPIGTNCYVLTDSVTGQAVVFDAPMTAWQVVEEELAGRQIKLVALCLTHGHWDHTLDAPLFNQAGIPVYGHVGDKFFFESPEFQSAFMLPGLDPKPIVIDVWLKSEETIEIGGFTFEVRLVPGHSSGSVLFYHAESGWAISGDAIFCGSVGRTDFPGCSFQVLEKSIRERIYTLPDTTVLFPGHGPSTDVESEKRENPYVRG